MAIWASLDHINVLPFKGFCFFPLGDDGVEETIFSLVSPWMAHGSIGQYIQSHPNVDRVFLASINLSLSTGIQR